AGKTTFDLAVQAYRGHPVLTWWQAAPDEDVIANRAYRTLAVVKAADGYGTDPHDFLITPQGTAWLMATRTVQADLSGLGGRTNGTIHDYVIQEVEIRTGRLVWQWDGYGHIPLRASYMPVPRVGPWDAFHLNSFQLLPDGNLLVCARNTWSVYKVSTRTGRIMWTLGGRENQFKMGPGTRFEWQHDARLVGNRLTLFDDASAPQEESQSSAKELLLQAGHRAVSLIHRYTHRPPLLSPAQGSMQLLPNGNVFVGWGTEPDFSEYTPAGQQILTGSLALGTSTYRAYRFPWTARPLTRPDVAVARAPHGRTTVWVSWNGATSVSSWRVLGGANPSHLRSLSTQPDRSFETRITVNTRPGYVKVQALDAHGHLLPHGSSSAKAVG
ncbi:MAG TPA: arylsulfotransferase family protein, partial [Solirubrobacteraceae bacterium]|nr:arylsulfotransferase family protein [Solirubrobacteraceae bacterium]